METDLANGMNALYGGQNRQSYHGYANHQQPHYGDAQQPGGHTLPPIQPHRQAYSQQNPSYEALGRQQQHPGHGMSYPGYGSTHVSQAPYSQGINQYSHGTYSQAPHQLSMAHDYQNAQPGLPNLRPMPPGSGSGGAHQYNVPQHMQEQDYASRTHVVGSQGRRGILPSDDGKPPAQLATTSGSTAKNAPIPPKDAEGKYPCPHCQKTYLHAKHLKRHLLRHTGDRPYSCILCNDTFSRSDILKRHFQKCSIRRGNPTGATHLSNSQSHLKKQQAKKTGSTTVPETGFPTAPHTPTSVTFSEGTGLGMSHIPLGNNAQGLSSRSDHDRQYDEGRRNVTGSNVYSRSSAGLHSLPSSGSSTPLTSRHSGQIPQSYTPDSTHTRMGSFSQSYQPNTTQNRHSMPQMNNPSHIESGYDWAHLQHTRDNPQLPSPVHNEASIRHDQDPSEMMSFFSRENGQPHDGLDNWSMLDTYKRRADRLTLFCQCNGINDPDDLLLSYCIAGENIEHFFRSHMHFDAHWSSLHLPTFNPSDLYDGLALAMICVGAVYSERLSHQQVRNLLRKTQQILEKNTTAYKIFKQTPTKQILDRCYDSLFFYKLATLQLVGIACWWHGNSEQREKALSDLPCYVKFAYGMGWFEPAPEKTPCFSVYHQPDPVSSIAFDWKAWVVQEQRLRWAYIWWMADSALNLYCNSPPVIDPTDIKLPLPADDACASALGLHGRQSQVKNVSGHRRNKSPELYLVVRALMNPNQDLAPRSTNAFSKFIMVHCLIIQIIKAHRNIFLELNYSLDSQRKHCDWIIPKTDNELIYLDESPERLLKATDLALSKFKRMWDEDMALQYPASTARIGFCRDDIVF